MDKTKLAGEGIGSRGGTSAEAALVEIPVGPLTEENKIKGYVKKWKRTAPKANKENVQSIKEGNRLRKRRALESKSHSATKKLRDEMEVDGEVHTKVLAEVGYSQPRQPL